MEGVQLDAWIHELTLEQLRDQAAVRGLEVEGTKAVVRQRLIRFERKAREEASGGAITPSPTVEIVANFEKQGKSTGASEKVTESRRQSGVPREEETRRPVKMFPNTVEEPNQEPLGQVLSENKREIERQNEESSEERSRNEWPRREWPTEELPPRKIPLGERPEERWARGEFPSYENRDYERELADRFREYREYRENRRPPQAYDSLPPRAYDPLVPPRTYDAVSPQAYDSLPPRAYDPLGPPRTYDAVPPRTYDSLPPRGYTQVPPREGGTVSASEAWNAMRRWNLNFTGARGSDPETFIRKIENGRAIVPMTDEDVLKCLPFFISGIAEHWFEARKGYFRSWNEFRNAFRSRFSDPDYQFALREEIIRRTQGEHEPVADYISCMLALFNRLVPPWSLREQLEYTHRNMLPRLQTAVRREDLENFDTLEMITRRMERLHLSAQHYRAPPLPENSMFPELAYRPPPRSTKPTPTMAATDVGRAESNGDRRRTTVAPTQPRVSFTPTGVAGPPRTGGELPNVNKTTRGTVDAQTAGSSRRSADNKCWNCGIEGHRARGCNAPRRIHCYRCGRADVTIKNCPQCTGNGTRRS